MTGDGYLLDNQQAEAGRRFDALSAIFDPWTFRHIDDLGIRPGWRCWEVGAGGPSGAGGPGGPGRPEGCWPPISTPPGWREPLPSAPRSAGMISPPTSRRLSFSTWFMPGWYSCT